MTQPGVTQHIRNMENFLDVELFHRVGKKLVPTKEAEIIYDGIKDSLASIESLLVSVSQKDRQFIGNVRIGVPIEFGNTYVLPNLSKIRAQFSKIQFHITYGLPHELNALLLDGKLDFAFMDQYQTNSAIKTEVVYHENLVLCCTKEFLELGGSQKKERTYFESLSYVDYQAGEQILRDWFERGFGYKKMKLNIASYCFDVQGIASLVRNSMGAGVLPEHVFLRLKDSGVNLHQFRSKSPVNNPISLAYLEQRWDIPLNKFVISMLKDMMGKKKGM